MFVENYIAQNMFGFPLYQLLTECMLSIVHKSHHHALILQWT